MDLDIDMESFVFTDGKAGNAAASELTALIPRGIKDKGDLLRTYQRVLKFPYFGMNWDALQDCLRDLDWINEETIIVVHEDLPSLSEADLKIYLSILSDTVKEWRADPLRRRLKVVFPEGLRVRLSKLAQ